MALRRTKEQQSAVDADARARRKWYANWGGGAPREPYTSPQRADLRALRRAKVVLIATVPGAEDYAEAIARLGYQPQYAKGWRQKPSAKLAYQRRIPTSVTRTNDHVPAPEMVETPPEPPAELVNILLPAYGRCSGFGTTCTDMRWEPAKGHVPRGFRGAIGQAKEVGLVLVLAEPGDPYEPVRGLRRDYLSKVYVASNRDLHRTDRFGPNVRLIMHMAWPQSPLEEQLKRTWLTESVLCSAKVESGSVPFSVERECSTRYLMPQLGLFPNARIVALGSKARDRLARLGWRVVAPREAKRQPPRAGERWFVPAPHPSHRGAKEQAIESWKQAVAGLKPA